MLSTRLAVCQCFCARRFAHARSFHKHAAELPRDHTVRLQHLWYLAVHALQPAVSQVIIEAAVYRRCIRTVLCSNHDHREEASRELRNCAITVKPASSLVPEGHDHSLPRGLNLVVTTGVTVSAIAKAVPGLPHSPSSMREAEKGAKVAAALILPRRAE